MRELASLPIEQHDPIELSPKWCAELLDPEGWRHTLETYAVTVNMAVALTDREGRLLGRCHNPRPVWKLLHQTPLQVDGGCVFCLASAVSCSAVVNTIKSGVPVLVEDRARLAHVAVPLTLDGHPLGALIAGQVFTSYPDSLPLQRVAKDLRISEQRLWHEAIQQSPVSQATMKTFATLLKTLGDAFLGRRYATVLLGRVEATNQKLSRALQEKQVLLNEIHHRVKNNLQTMSSLLNMQSDGLDSVNDVKAIAMLEASQQRIVGMARIHELLYSNDYVGEIELATYVKDVTEMVMSSYEAGDIRFQAIYSLAPGVLSIRQAIPCGMIINELVSNVCKYAYSNGRGGDIYIDLKAGAGDRIALTIADHGCGLPRGLDWRRSESVGLRIVDILAKQLRGTLELNSQHGTAFTLEFTTPKR